MPRVADYIAEKIAERGWNDVFMVTGGGAMHLNHSFGTHPQLDCIFNHHEQACAMRDKAVRSCRWVGRMIESCTGPHSPLMAGKHTGLPCHHAAVSDRQVPDIALYC